MAAHTATLLLTRPRDASLRFANEVTAGLSAELRVVVSPLLEIVPTGQTPDFADVRGVIFTSAHGVTWAGPAARIPAFCVGRRTTEAAAQAGWQAQYMGRNAAELVETLKRSAPDTPLLHVGGVHRRGDIAGSLTRAGYPTSEVAVYDQKALPLSDEARAALQEHTEVVVPLMSPRTARLFAEQAADRHGLYLIAVSDAVVEELGDFPLAEITVARCPDAENMREATVAALRRVEHRGAAD